ncbi:MAG: thymidine phosphorylase [Firmicutes bacterium]|nr:thymidine phosphorylase [Bacillota bacterium]
MLMYEILNKKKHGQELTTSEIRWVVDGFTSGEIPAYQMSALLMAVCLKGMTTRETADLTMAMADSGDIMDLSCLGDKTIDKHSTGGVGDKTTLIVGPIIAAIGLPVAKMSGRGLGHTGGTIDKLQSIPGFRTEMTTEEFLDNVKKHGLCIAGQSGNLVPADKKIYALRDVTATVDSIPLIAASIMSKKIAAGAGHILLDVKTGNGAFMKDLRDARALAEAMVNIGNGCGRKTAAIITDMSAPLGRAIGNNLEVKEVIRVLSDCRHSAQDLLEVSVAIAANMLYMVDYAGLAACEAKVMEVLENGAALDKFAEMVEAQGGDRSYIENPDKFEVAKYTRQVCSSSGGYIGSIDTEGLGIAAMILGAGRKTPEDEVCYSSGIVLTSTIGSYVEKGQIIALLYTNDKNSLLEAEHKFIESIKLTPTMPQTVPLIHDKIGL